MNVSEIIDQMVKGVRPPVEDIADVLATTDRTEMQLLFDSAARMRDRRFGDKIFTYGFVYFSTYCKNNCAFCYYRRSSHIDRYRKTKDEVLALSAALEDAGINQVDLTMGEDPHMYRDDYKELVDLVQGVRDTVDIGIMVSPGAVSQAAMPRLRDAGADWFACYQETYNR